MLGRTEREMIRTSAISCILKSLSIGLLGRHNFSSRSLPLLFIFRAPSLRQSKLTLRGSVTSSYNGCIREYKPYKNVIKCKQIAVEERTQVPFVPWKLIIISTGLLS
jgi:hypothetical protein